MCSKPITPSKMDPFHKDGNTCVCVFPSRCVCVCVRCNSMSVVSNISRSGPNTRDSGVHKLRTKQQQHPEQKTRLLSSSGGVVPEGVV